MRMYVAAIIATCRWRAVTLVTGVIIVTDSQSMLRVSPNGYIWHDWVAAIDISH